MTAEEWRPIAGFEGLYEVSNHGRVRSLDRVIARSNGVPYRARGRVLKPTPHRRGKRPLAVSLADRGRRHQRLVHRLLAEAFGAAS
jgi:hypothetical protein